MYENFKSDLDRVADLIGEGSGSQFVEISDEKKRRVANDFEAVTLEAKGKTARFFGIDGRVFFALFEGKTFRFGQAEAVLKAFEKAQQ